jgi:hypothetical protein
MVRVLRLALAGCVVAVSVAAFSGPAGAQSPRLQGWWASTNPGGLPVAPPQPPDVPADGLLVQAGPSGPSAYAALTYDLESGATADALTLQLAPGALPSAPPTLALCALKQQSFSAQQGGPMGDAPAYDCNRTATATLDGASFTFKVAGLVSDGMLAVAVVPGDPSTRAVLAHPSQSSLTVTSGSAVVGTTVPPVSDPGSGTSTSGAGAAAPPALPGLTGTAAVTAPDAGAVPPDQVATGGGQAPAVAAAPGATALTNTTPAAVTHTTGALRRVLLVLVVAVLASAAVAWAFVGTGPVAEEATA